MEANVGIRDKSIRIVLLIIIGGLHLSGVISGVWASVTVVLVVILGLTSIFNFCPIYKVLGISSKDKN